MDVLGTLPGVSLSSCLCKWFGSQVGVDSFRVGQGQLLEGKWPRFLGDFALLVVERLDAVGGVDDLVQHRREGQEGHEPCGGPDQVDHAGLDGGLRPGGFDGLGQAGQPVTAHDQHVTHAAVGQLGTDPGPELGSFMGLDPNT